MKTMHALRLLSVAGIGTLLALPSIAQQDNGYFYGGGSLGQSRAKLDVERYSTSILGPGQVTVASDRDTRANAFKVFGGYQFNRYFGMEAGYFDLGRFSFVSDTVPGGTFNGLIKVVGTNIDVVGTLPITDNLSALARVGAQYARTRGSFSGTAVLGGVDASPSDREANYKVGGGLQWDVSPSMLVRAEAERYRISDAVGNHAGLNVFSLSMLFPFGR